MKIYEHAIKERHVNIFEIFRMKLFNCDPYHVCHLNLRDELSGNKNTKNFTELQNKTPASAGVLNIFLVFT